MQYTIHFDESLMPKEIRAIYKKMISQLPDLSIIQSPNLPELAQIAINTARLAMAEIEQYIQINPFISDDSEIRYFKMIKPLFHAQLIFWISIFEIELSRPVGGAKSEKKFLKNRLQAITDFFTQHIDFYRYYRAGWTNQDRFFFLGLHSDKHGESQSVEEIEVFSYPTADLLVARILANDLLKQYLSEHLSNTSQIQSVNKEIKTKSLQWTASKTGLIELIYALQSGGVYNNGQAGIKEVAESFQQLFQVDLGNYYHAFNEIRLRKKSRTILLDLLKEKVIQKMDTMDENQADR